MKKYYNKIIIVFCASFYLPAVYAADGYMGLDIGQMGMDFTTRDVSKTRYSGTVSPIVSKARIGVVLMPDSATHLSIESHLGFSVSDGSASINGEKVNMQLDTLLALYLKADLLTVGSVSVFGLVGYGSVQSNPRIDAVPDAKNEVQHLPETESSTSWGLGFSYFINKNWSWQMEYLDLVTGDTHKDKELDLGFDVSGVTIGVNRVLE